MNNYYKNCAFPKPISKKHKRVVVSQETYNKVFNACNGSCVLCKTTKNLELHHILGRGKDLTDNPKNCVMLCNNCHHNKVHADLKFYRPLLLKIAERIYKDEL